MAKPTPTPEQIAKLPAWAREHIENLQRERNASLRTLNQFVDGQKPSPLYTDAWECTGESSGPTTKRHFLQTTSVNFVVDPAPEGMSEDCALVVEIRLNRELKRLEVRTPRQYPYIEPAGNNLFYVVKKPDV